MSGCSSLSRFYRQMDSNYVYFIAWTKSSPVLILYPFYYKFLQSQGLELELRRSLAARRALGTTLECRCWSCRSRSWQRFPRPCKLA